MICLQEFRLDVFDKRSEFLRNERSCGTDNTPSLESQVLDQALSVRKGGL